MKVRKADSGDVISIKEIIDENLDTLIERTEEEITKFIPSFYVLEDNGEIIGCSSLEIYSPRLGELRSIAIRKNRRGEGLGRTLVQKTLEEVKKENVKEILVVTSNPEFFKKLDFQHSLNERYALFWNNLKT